MKRSIIAVAALLLLSVSAASADPGVKKPEVGIDDKIGNYIPLDARFYDEHGYLVTLKDVITKPTILNFVYFKCPGICSPILTELTTVVNKMDMEIGKDYQIVTISFDETEKPDLAESKHENYMALINHEIPKGAWKFLTGDSASIRSVTDAAGFYFTRQGKDFLHAGAIIAVSPEGKIARYLYGTQYLPFDVKMALVEAGEGKTGPTVNKLLRYCYSYNPEGRKYVMNVTRIAGAGMLVLVAGFVVFLTVKPKKR
ncbi:MAG: SCO family protein [Acidobacteriota bacterium]